MAHETDLPSDWWKVLQGLHANSLWILPLVAIERGFEGHPIQAAIAAGAWFIAALAAVKYHLLQALFSNREGRQRLLTWTIIFAGAAVLAFGIYRLGAQQRTASPVVIHDPPTQEQIAAAAKPQVDEITQQRDEAIQQRNDAREALAKAVRPAPTPPQPVVINGSPLGPQTTLSIVSGLSSPPLMEIRSPNPKGTKWMLIFSPSEDKTKSLIFSLLAAAGLDVQWFPPADRNTFPEAPDLQASGDTGITFHGNSALSRRLLEVLQLHRCMIVHHREKTPDNLQQWYGHSARGDEREVVWIEIGSGPIWTMNEQCRN